MAATVYFGATLAASASVNVSGDATLDFESMSAGSNGQFFVGDDLGVGTITQNGANSTVILNVVNTAQFGSNASNIRAEPGNRHLQSSGWNIGDRRRWAPPFGMDAGGVGILNQSGGN